MTIDGAIVTQLKTVTALTAYIGTGSNVRIYPATTEPVIGTFPYIIYAEISCPEGKINQADNFKKYYQFTIYSQNGYDEIQAIKSILRKAFKHLPKLIYTEVDVISGKYIDERDLPFDTQLNIYGGSIDVYVNYIEN